MERSESGIVDSALVSRARQGDRAARAALYESLSVEIHTLVRRIVGLNAAAEDLLHDVFIDAFTRLGELREDGAFPAWLRRIAVNRSISHLRSSWVSKRVAWTDEDFASLPAPLDRHVDSGRLEAALDALPDAARVVVWLYDVEGYTHREIADLTGLSVSSSKTRLSRARANLRAVLGSDIDLDQEESLCVGELKTI